FNFGGFNMGGFNFGGFNFGGFNLGGLNFGGFNMGAFNFGGMMGMMMGGKFFGFAGGELVPSRGYRPSTGVGIFGGGLAGIGTPPVFDPISMFYEKRSNR
ncbi:MAG: hypothetical protein NZ914_14805, partial [Gemmatales bacterium]|nr:hypothetical protein [Gemmatales bacterium]